MVFVLITMGGSSHPTQGVCFGLCLCLCWKVNHSVCVSPIPSHHHYPDDMGAQKMGICVQTCLSQLGTPLLAVLIGCAGGTGDLKVCVSTLLFSIAE